MKKLRKVSNEEMVSVFLKAEINSSRWNGIISSILQEKGIPVTVITHPNLDDKKENEVRKVVLGMFRGYEKNSLLFGGFPQNVDWFYVSLNKNELSRVKYMNYDYWKELSKGTRLPQIAAATIQEGNEIFGTSNKPFIDASEAFQKGVPFPRMIFVAQSDDADIVILEGHLRMTASFLVPESITEETEVIIGFSSDIVSWGGY